MIFFLFVLIIIILEILIIFLVNIQRKSFPWLINEKDSIPSFPSEALHKFLNYSFDPTLGWVRKPNTSGVEMGRTGNITFHINQSGSRSSSYEALIPKIAVFGDSYAFCRQVGDDETWEALISKNCGFGVLNYGVGNYGFDQALLRYEKETLPVTVKFVMMGFVPETICRIQSYWKHYLEYGNIFAFKPRFDIDVTGKLQLIPNIMQDPNDFYSFKDKIKNIQKVDRHYKSKFLKEQFRFPYLYTLFRNPVKIPKLFFFIGLRSIFRKLKFSIPFIENLPFSFVMMQNLADSHKYYSESHSIKLMEFLIERFKNEASQRGHIPVLIIFPQLYDLKIGRSKRLDYQKFFERQNSKLAVIDLTEPFKNGDHQHLYINDHFGGHLSLQGNELAAKEIAKFLISLESSHLC